MGSWRRIPRHPSVCPYFPERQALLDEAWAMEPVDGAELDELLAHGWRHFSGYFFRDACPECLACIPLRVPVYSFEPSRGQRRVLRNNADTAFEIMRVPDLPATVFDEALAVYDAFGQGRYGKPPVDAEQFKLTFFSSPTPTFVSLCRVGGKLAGVGFLDRGATTLSTIYFAFDPAFAELSPGTFSILREIQWAREQGLAWYYLGYWIPGHAAMDYKALIRPHQRMDWAAETWSDAPG